MSSPHHQPDSIILAAQQALSAEYHENPIDVFSTWNAVVISIPEAQWSAAATRMADALAPGWKRHLPPKPKESNAAETATLRLAKQSDLLRIHRGSKPALPAT